MGKNTAIVILIIDNFVQKKTVNHIYLSISIQ